MTREEHQQSLTLLFTQAELNLETNIEKANRLTDEAYLESLDVNDSDGIAKSMFLFGVIKFKMREFSAANDYFESCLHTAIKNLDFELKSKTLKCLGDLRLEVNDFEGALEFYMNCLEISSTQPHTFEERVELLSGLGRIYKELEQYNIALEYFEEALGICKSKKNTEKISLLYSYISECTMDEGRLVEAEQYVHNAIQLAAESESDFDFGYAYMVYAKYLYVHSEYKESRLFFEKSMKKFNAIHKPVNLLEAMAEYGIMLFKSEAYQEAEDVLAECSIMMIHNQNYKVELKVNLYLSKLYEKTGQVEKALSYYKRFFEMKTVNDETWKTIKVKNTINKYEYLRTDIKVRELTNTNENLVALSKLGRGITSTLNQNEIIDKISHSIHQLIECDSYGVGFVDKEKNILDYITIQGGHQKKIRVNLKNKTSFLMDLLKDKKELFDNDFENTRNLTCVRLSFNGLEHSASMMSCALTFEKDVIGLLTVQSKKKDAFVENDLEMLRILSSYTTIAINNSMQSKAMLDTNRKLKDLTEKDGLTKVFNRYSLNTNIDRIIQKSKKYEKPMSVIMIDVDFFKEFNDNYGHLAGDHCLVSVSQVLNETFAKEKSYIYRYGGDEFLIIVLDRDEAEVESLARDLLAAIANLNIEHLFSKCADRVSLTIGVATIKKVENDYKKIFALADKALYTAKNKGRNNVIQLIYE